MDYVWLTVGLALVALGAELLVRGSVGLAARLGVSPLLVGLTVVAWGTSTPELVVSMEAALKGSTGLAVGNAVGSNIFNILAIVGIAALVAPIASPKRAAVARDSAVGIAAALALFILAMRGEAIGVEIGVAFLAALALYTALVFTQERRAPVHSAPVQLAEEAQEKQRFGLLALLLSVVAGLAALLYGANLLVDSGVAIAERWGVSDTVIGLTLIAGGTSLPELATSTVAALRRHGDIAIGNVLGSNIYNILVILGATALVTPLPLPERIGDFDLPLLLGVSLFLVLLLAVEGRVGRVSGLVLVAGFVLYVYAAFAGLT